MTRRLIFTGHSDRVVMATDKVRFFNAKGPFEIVEGVDRIPSTIEWTHAASTVAEILAAQSEDPGSDNFGCWKIVSDEPAIVTVQ